MMMMIREKDPKRPRRRAILFLSVLLYTRPLLIISHANWNKIYYIDRFSVTIDVTILSLSLSSQEEEKQGIIERQKASLYCSNGKSILIFIMIYEDIQTKALSHSVRAHCIDFFLFGFVNRNNNRERHTHIYIDRNHFRTLVEYNNN